MYTIHQYRVYRSTTLCIDISIEIKYDKNNIQHDKSNVDTVFFKTIEPVKSKHANPEEAHRESGMPHHEQHPARVG